MEGLLRPLPRVDSRIQRPDSYMKVTWSPHCMLRYAPAEHPVIQHSNASAVNRMVPLNGINKNYK